MSDIIDVSLEDFKKDHTVYKNKKVRINEFRFFATSNMLYDDYYLKVGPRGGVIVHYGKPTKKLNCGFWPFKEATVKDGAVHNTGWGYNASKSTIFPSPHRVPNILANMERWTKETVEKHQKTIDNATARFEKIKAIVDEYPEYSL